MLTPSRRSTSALPTPQTQPSSTSTSRAEVVEVPLRVGRVLAGDHHDPAAVAAYGGERLVRAGQHRDVGHGMVGVERPEPVTCRADLVGAAGAAPAIWSSGGPSFEVSSSTGNSTPSSAPSTRSTAREPGHGVDERHVQVEADRELTGHA